MEMNAREARRKKILERGSDRLALISGQIPSLPSSSSSNPQLHVSSYGEKNTFGMLSSKQEIFNESAEYVECTSLEGEADDNKIEKPAHNTNSKVQPSSSSSVVPHSLKTSVNSEPHQPVEPKFHLTKFLSVDKVSSSISASENIRVLCSVCLAFLVILSHLRFPLLGSRIIKGIVASRPLYLLLLTDISIIFAPLFLKQSGCQKPQEELKKIPAEERNSHAEAIGKALEVALVLYKIFTAAFLDCSIYVVAVICGFSLAQFK
ncbi:hypothetical protein Syun_025944 [Stephania yunnanensis]|uniref:Uncharacterized protein n=1 Tax=Stephania yunnanensis TaxID=152371 RepID=A0AAP0ET26_9MAGN